jgi:hypothetical protein
MTNKTNQQDTNTLIMLDLETLDLSPRSVVTQCAFIAVSIDDPEVELRRVDQYLPVQPQIELGRVMSFDTVLWWMKQEDAARLRFIENSGTDMEELLALVRSIHRKLTEVINQAGGKQHVEVWARGPQFDVVNLATLFADCGLQAPWAYDRVMDLRTTMRLAGVKSETIDSSGITPHVAIDDCRFQLRGYIEAMKHLRGRS